MRPSNKDVVNMPSSALKRSRHPVSLRNVLMCSLLAASLPCLADGPLGIGPLKLGMSKEDVEVLPEGGVRIAAPLTTYRPPGNAPAIIKMGEEKFDTLLHTPWSGTPLKAVLTFRLGKLQGVYVSWHDDGPALEPIVNQVAEKYGPAKVADRTTTERCPSAGGGVVEVKNGTYEYSWSQDVDNREVRTNISSYVIDGCLGRRYNQRRTTLNGLSISYVPKTSNPF